MVTVARGGRGRGEVREDGHGQHPQHIVFSKKYMLEPTPESFQIDAPGYHFVDFWSQRQKASKSMLPVIILSTSGAKARKSSNRVFSNFH